MTKAAQLLKYVSTQPEGCTFTEMQRYVVEKLNGLDFELRRVYKVWDNRQAKMVNRTFRVHRGWWCDYLPSITRSYMTKDTSGRYTVSDAGFKYIAANC